ncbi:hypothetical protein D9M72_373380 [compost metagenome]
MHHITHGESGQRIREGEVRLHRGIVAVAVQRMPWHEELQHHADVLACSHRCRHRRRVEHGGAGLHCAGATRVGKDLCTPTIDRGRGDLTDDVEAHRPTGLRQEGVRIADAAAGHSSLGAVGAEGMDGHVAKVQARAARAIPGERDAILIRGACHRARVGVGFSGAADTDTRGQ